MTETAIEAEFQQWDSRQRDARGIMIDTLTKSLSFLHRVDAIQSAISTPPGESDASFAMQAVDFRNAGAYYCSLQSVWTDLLAAMHIAGKGVFFVPFPPSPDPEQYLSIVLEKELVLEQLLADRLEKMLVTPGAASEVELQKLLDSATSRIDDLERKRSLLPKAIAYFNQWDQEADRYSSFSLERIPTYSQRVEEADDHRIEL